MKHRSCLFSDILFYGLLFLAVGLYLSVLRFGMADIDEGFYLTIPYRMTQGDRLLADEWHLSQLSAFLTWPVMELYLLIGKGTEGIVLAFRGIYLFMWAATCVISYHLLAKRNRWAAAASALMVFLFTPFGIKALSYNTMGLMAVWLFVVLGLANPKRQGLCHALRGLLLAAAVLCNPYMILFAVIWFILTAVNAVSGKRSRTFTWRNLWYMALGAGLLLAAFLLFELTGASPMELLAGLPYILFDPAHPRKTLSGLLASFRWFPNNYPTHFFLWGIFTLAALILALLRQNCAKERKRLFDLLSVTMFAAACLTMTALTLYFALRMTSGVGYNAIMLPFSMMGLSAFLLTRKKSWDLLGGWLIGLFYALCMSMSSNNGIYVVPQALTVSSAVSVFMILSYGRQWKKNVWVLLLPLLVCQFFAEGYVLTHHFFWEGERETMTERIESGPLAGVVTTPYKAERYMENCENLLWMRGNGQERILLYCHFPSGYLLLSDMENPACSAWLQDSVADPTDKEITAYQRLHPDKTPDSWYVDAQSVGVWTKEEWQRWCEDNGFAWHIFPNGAYGFWE